jgi:hypothetical protein
MNYENTGVRSCQRHLTACGINAWKAWISAAATLALLEGLPARRNRNDIALAARFDNIFQPRRPKFEGPSFFVAI